MTPKLFTLTHTNFSSEHNRKMKKLRGLPPGIKLNPQVYVAIVVGNRDVQIKFIIRKIPVFKLKGRISIGGESFTGVTRRNNVENSF